MKKIFFLFVLTSCVLSFTKAQQMKDSMKMNMPMKDSMNMKRINNTQHDSMPGMNMNGMNMSNMNTQMTHSYSLSLPMNRDGSGTSWSPDNNPMYMLMSMGKKSMWMFHGSFFLRYNTQQLTNNTSRSSSKIDAPNWFMAMYDKQIGKKGLFNFSSMFSLDPLTVGASGYPLLFQSGESYKGSAFG